MSETSDIECIVSVLNDHPDDFGRLVEAYSGKVYALVKGIVGNDADAEDLTQDIFVTAWRKLSSFGRRSSFSTWLYRIAYNTAISSLRRRRLPTVGVDERRTVEVEDTVEATAFSDADIESLNGALEELAPKERAVIEMFYTHDMPLAQIAAVTATSEGNAKVMLFRARKKLAVLIKRRRDDE